jgi:type II secretory pathway component GspD/PulD (secretin)
MPGKRFCLVSALAACAAFGQNTTQTFYFTHVDDPQVLQEYLNSIRSISEVPTGTQDLSKKSITVQGTTEQVSIAAWLAKELNDAPASRQAPIRHDYPGNASPNHLVQITFLAHTSSGRELQELVNLTRSTADIQRFFPCNAIDGIVSRGTPEQADMANWLIGQMDQPAGTLKPGHVDHAFPSDPRANSAQLYVLGNIESVQAIQEAVNAVRTVADLQRLFPSNSRKALVMRGSSDQVAFADWMLGLLDRPASAAPDTTAHEYKYNTGNARDTASIARVFFVNTAENSLQLQQLTNEVRTATQMQRTFPNYQAKAILLRGTGDQVSRAEQILKDK